MRKRCGDYCIRFDGLVSAYLCGPLGGVGLDGGFCVFPLTLRGGGGGGGGGGAGFVICCGLSITVYIERYRCCEC